MQALTNRDRDFKDYALYDSIDYYDRWGLAVSAQKHLIEQEARKNDSISKLTISKDRLKQALTEASLRNERQENELDKNRTSIRNIYMISGIIILSLIAIIVMVRKANKLQIQRNEIESEKSALESEGFRASYLDHAISNNFKYIVSKIQIGMYRLDMSKLQSAVKISQKLGTLFYNISRNSTGETTLAEEMQTNIRYVGLISECVDNPIACHCHIDQTLSQKIKVPMGSLIDFYINAIHHGRLDLKVGASILTTLRPLADSQNQYTLTIQNNGVGIGEAERSKPLEHKSTGHERVKKRFALFNKEVHGSLLAFDAFSDALDASGSIVGTRVTIKITIS
jgi:hypothetical protein